MIYMLYAFIISFLYTIVESFIKKLLPKILKYTVYIWAFIILILSILIHNNYIWNFPQIRGINIMGIFFIALIIIFFLSKNSGYEPVGRFNCINFVLVYPIFEEFSFRGLIVPLISRCSNIDNFFVAIISAFLFAISHLQYYKLNRQTIHFMFYAFIGGLFFANIVIGTKSVLLAIILHIAFNLSATYHSKTVHHVMQ